MKTYLLIVKSRKIKLTNKNRKLEHEDTVGHHNAKHREKFKCDLCGKCFKNLSNFGSTQDNTQW